MVKAMKAMQAVNASGTVEVSDQAQKQKLSKQVKKLKRLVRHMDDHIEGIESENAILLSSLTELGKKYQRLQKKLEEATR
jgi:predicted nuclease with TOPRIM domain